MAIKYGSFEMPKSKKIDKISEDKKYARFILEPFERGFGHTIGHALRRILLTSIEAPAIISVRIEGVPHEYTAIDGVIEDMTNIILNLKAASLRKHPHDNEPRSHEPVILSNIVQVQQSEIDENGGQYVVTLKDVFKSGNFEIVNPDLPLFTVTKPFHRQIDLRVAIGRGYVPSERHALNDVTAEEILMDAAFSPVRLVNYRLENTRVGQDTDFDRLIFEITTDGRIQPEEALIFASQIAVKHFEMFAEIETQQLNFDEYEEESEENNDEMLDKLILRIDEIELSVRSTNCLSGANIETIGELVSIPERRMLEFRNFGKKSLNEIKAKLHEMGLHLGMDLGRYGINSDNVKDKITQYAAERKASRELALAEEQNLGE